ncbi:hypothetical protein PENSPDRAFT_752198 [Peniophora sp. CONT]|nr:hypothetical protein PENSPDRAFT_752198 [Peniophora sp. CONT]
MEQVVSTPELVDMIFAHMPRKDNVATALVSKRWLEHSRDHIWFHISDAKELFPLLAPLKEDHELDFVRIPQQEDWQRFEPFSRRVHKMTFGKVVSVSSAMAYTLLRSSSRPNPIFPNLRSLGWSLSTPETSNDSIHTLFLHSGVRQLALFNIVQERVNWEFLSLRALFLEVVNLAPHITKLNVRPQSHKVDGMADAIVDLVTRLPSLTRISVAPPLLTTTLLQSLSRHPYLEEIVPRFENGNTIWHARDPRSTAEYLGPVVLGQDTFKALKTLHLSMPIQAAIHFLADENSPAGQLLDLRVRVLDCVSNTVVRDLLAVIAASCRSLLDFALFLYPPKFALDKFNGQLESLDANTVEPLHQIKTLQTLYIYHLVPTSVSEAQLLQLLDSLPHLTELLFVPRPDWTMENSSRRPSPSAFTWHTLAIILQNFPRIRELGLYLDLSPQSADSSLLALRSLPNDGLPSSTLRILNVGTTAVPPATAPDIAFKLLTLLGSQVRLAWGPQTGTMWGVPTPGFTEPSLESKLKDWEEVSKLLYFGFSARSGVYHRSLGDHVIV